MFSCLLNCCSFAQRSERLEGKEKGEIDSKRGGVPTDTDVAIEQATLEHWRSTGETKEDICVQLALPYRQWCIVSKDSTRAKMRSYCKMPVKAGPRYRRVEMEDYERFGDFIRRLENEVGFDLKAHLLEFTFKACE